MPEISEKIKDFYSGLVEKAWAVSDKLEGKGIPLSSFCDKYNINPLFVFIGIILVIAILILLLLFPGGYAWGTLTIEVVEDGISVPGATVSYTVDDISEDNITNDRGKADLPVPIGKGITISASKANYNSGSVSYTLEDEVGSAKITITRKVGDLRIEVTAAGDRELPSNAYVRITSPGIGNQQASIINGEALFEGLPAGIDVQTFVVLGGQDVEGRTITIQEGITNTVTISISESSLLVTLNVKVEDALGADVNGADVELREYDTNTFIESGTTLYGQIAFEVPLGTRVYAIVSSSNPMYGTWDGRARNMYVDITGQDLVYRIVLQIVGRVEVCVYDEDGYPLGTGWVRLKDTSGRDYGVENLDSACADYYGIPENAMVYPEVTAAGYLTHSNPSEARVVDYSSQLSFDVTMQPIPTDEAVEIYARVEDCDGEPINGVEVRFVEVSTDAVLAEERTSCTGAASVITGSSGCSGATDAVTVRRGNEIYAVAFDEDYVLGRSGIEIVYEASILEIIMCEADSDNSGDLEVCVFKDGDPYDESLVTLYDEYGDYLWQAETEDDEDGDDHCHIFMNIPAYLTIYAEASNLGTSPEDSELVTIEPGELSSVDIYAGSQPVILDKGNVDVCVKDVADESPIAANVEIYDWITEDLMASKAAEADGCALFSDIDAEINNDGFIEDRRIYVVASATNYGSYNGKSVGESVTMMPDSTVSTNLYLYEAFEICVGVMEDGDGLKDAQVSLYYTNAEGAVPVETKSTTDGRANFIQSQRDVYWFKVVETYSMLDAMPIYEFQQAEVSYGACGTILLYSLSELCKLGLEILNDNTTIETTKQVLVKVPIRLLWDGSVEYGNIIDAGSIKTKQQVMLPSGEIANITLRLDGEYIPFSLAYGYIRYSPDDELILTFNAPEEEGTYYSVVEVEINPACSRSRNFDLKVIHEALSIRIDAVEIDKSVDEMVQFCIYVRDQDGGIVDDATVGVYLDTLDGWLDEYDRAALWNENKECYRGQISPSAAPDEDTFLPMYISARRGELEKKEIFDVKIMPTEDLCGNGVCDEEYETCEDCPEDCGECPPECGDEVCEGDENCENCPEDCEECTPESVYLTADTATIGIGEATGTGFCVYFYEGMDRTDVEDGTITATFGADQGWASDSQVVVNFDPSRGCYYIPVSPNQIRPDLERSYTIFVYGETTDGRSARTTTTALTTCNCGWEDWCEPQCPCDYDCRDIAGPMSLNLLDCVRISSNAGYYPTPPGGNFNPYNFYGGGGYSGGGYMGSQYGGYGGYAGGSLGGGYSGAYGQYGNLGYPNYGTPYGGAYGQYGGTGGYAGSAAGVYNYQNPYGGYGSGYPSYGTGYYGGGGGFSMLPGGGFSSMTPSGSFTLDLQRCLDLFRNLGWNKDSGQTTNVNKYVLILDHNGAITTDKKNKNGECYQIEQYLKKNGMKAFYVDNLAGGTDTCYSTSNQNNFMQAFRSAYGKGETATIDLKKLTSSDARQYNDLKLEVIQADQNGAVLWDKKNSLLFGKGVYFSGQTTKRSSGDSQSNRNYIWGGLDGDALSLSLNPLVFAYDRKVGYSREIQNRHDPKYTGIIVGDRFGTKLASEGEIPVFTGSKISKNKLSSLGSMTQIAVVAEHKTSSSRSSSSGQGSLARDMVDDLLGTGGCLDFYDVGEDVQVCESDYENREKTVSVGSKIDNQPVYAFDSENNFYIGIGKKKACEFVDDHLEFNLGRREVNKIGMRCTPSRDRTFLITALDGDVMDELIDDFNWDSSEKLRIYPERSDQDEMGEITECQEGDEGSTLGKHMCYFGTSAPDAYTDVEAWRNANRRKLDTEFSGGEMLDCACIGELEERSGTIKGTIYLILANGRNVPASTTNDNCPAATGGEPSCVKEWAKSHGITEFSFNPDRVEIKAIWAEGRHKTGRMNNRGEYTIKNMPLGKQFTLNAIMKFTGKPPGADETDVRRVGTADIRPTDNPQDGLQPAEEERTLDIHLEGLPRPDIAPGEGKAVISGAVRESEGGPPITGKPDIQADYGQGAYFEGTEKATDGGYRLEDVPMGRSIRIVARYGSKFGSVLVDVNKDVIQQDIYLDKTSMGDLDQLDVLGIEVREDNHPIASNKISAFRAVDEDGFDVNWFPGSGQGEYVIQGEKGKRVEVTVTHKGIAEPGRGSGEIGQFSPLIINFQDETAPGAPGKCNVKGKVIGGDGKAIGGADVYVYIDNRLETRGGTRGDPGDSDIPMPSYWALQKGMFELPVEISESPSKIAIIARKNNEDGERIIDGSLLDAIVECARDGGERDIGDIRISSYTETGTPTSAEPKKKCNVRGIVLGDDGIPVSGAEVEIIISYGNDHWSSFKAESQRDGAFAEEIEFSGSPIGIEITANKDNKEIVVPIPGGAFEELVECATGGYNIGDLKIPECREGRCVACENDGDCDNGKCTDNKCVPFGSCIIRGRVLDKHGAPVDGAEITAKLGVEAVDKQYSQEGVFEVTIPTPEPSVTLIIVTATKKGIGGYKSDVFMVYNNEEIFTKIVDCARDSEIIDGTRGDPDITVVIPDYVEGECDSPEDCGPGETCWGNKCVSDESQTGVARITGRVVEEVERVKKPVKGAQVSLIIEDIPPFTALATGDNGIFEIEARNLPDWGEIRDHRSVEILVNGKSPEASSNLKTLVVRSVRTNTQQAIGDLVIEETPAVGDTEVEEEHAQEQTERLIINALRGEKFGPIELTHVREDSTHIVWDIFSHDVVERLNSNPNYNFDMPYFDSSDLARNALKTLLQQAWVRVGKCNHYNDKADTHRFKLWIGSDASSNWFEEISTNSRVNGLVAMGGYVYLDDLRIWTKLGVRILGEDSCTAGYKDSKIELILEFPLR